MKLLCQRYFIHQVAATLLLMLFFATCAGTAMPIESNKSTYAEGQVWTFHPRPGEDGATLLINRIESHPKLGEIFHVSVFGVRLDNPVIAGAVITELPHFPVSRETLDKSCLQLQGMREPNPDYLPGYDHWREAFDAGKAGVFDIPVAEIVDVVQQAIAQQRAD